TGDAPAEEDPRDRDADVDQNDGGHLLCHGISFFVLNIRLQSARPMTPSCRLGGNSVQIPCRPKVSRPAGLECCSAARLHTLREGSRELVRAYARRPIAMTVSRSPSILIVDDDPHIREVVRFALRKEGFSTSEAG